MYFIDRQSYPQSTYRGRVEDISQTIDDRILNFSAKWDGFMVYNIEDKKTRFFFLHITR